MVVCVFVVVEHLHWLMVVAVGRFGTGVLVAVVGYRLGTVVGWGVGWRSVDGLGRRVHWLRGSVHWFRGCVYGFWGIGL